ncbi:hypothetical protein [Cyanobium sp. LEGE 06113]|uniref:hypothetical protein n=1 Tax=Cyanobium sp. LEGE 06113 TaxID=1297573 RepID=UPI0018813D03|nr:hypothetical protein [Cyanobium sp. LEGE 06113]MBE9155160.1 hypothetical protein [Cyanobium sp. LEGE 06113]
MAPLSGKVLRKVERQAESGKADLVESLRERSVQAFEVPSARSPQTPPVVGVLTPPYAFSSTPFDVQHWTLEITTEGVTAVCFGGAFCC